MLLSFASLLFSSTSPAGEFDVAPNIWKVEAPKAQCNCGAGPSPVADTCVTKGDPHFYPFGKAGTNKFDFQGIGAYQLAKAPTTCGCDVEIQAWMAPNWKFIGATSNIGIAMKAGNSLFVVRSDGSLTFYDGQTPTSMGKPNAASADGIKKGVSTLRKVTIEKRGQTLAGWEISIPGGGSLIVYSFPMSGRMPTGYYLGAWVNLPQAAVSSATGLCCEYETLRASNRS